MSFIYTPQTTAAGASFTATASGALTKGGAVSINTDATVSASGFSTSQPNSFTSATFINSNSGTGQVNDWNTNQLVFDETNQIYVWIYPNGSGYLSIKVGTISSNTITWGTATVLVSYSVPRAQIIFDKTKNKYVVFYSDGTTLYAVVVTITGTTISAGTPVSVYLTNGSIFTSCYDSVNDKILVTWENFSSYTIDAYVGTVSGTSITFGTITSNYALITPGDSCTLGSAFNPSTGKFVVMVANSTALTFNLYLGAISGTTITFTGNYGATAIAAAIPYPIGVYESKYNKLIFNTGANVIWGIGTTGTSPTRDFALGTITLDFNSGGGFANDPTNNVVYLVGNTTSPNSASFILKTLTLTSPTTITSTTQTIPYTTTTITAYNYQIVYSTTLKKSTIMIGSLSGYYYEVGYSTNYTNFIGFSQDNYANGALATISNIASVDKNQAGLTPASKYYVGLDGTLSTTPATTTVYAGTALSATSILIKGQP
jgi:hypothetical protein